jgi:anti-sigma factor RsiW
VAHEAPCNRCREQITVRVDGELQEPEEVAALAEHLRDCEGCRVFAAAEAATKQLIAAAYGRPVEVRGLQTRLRKRLDALVMPRRWTWRAAAPRLAWGAIAAILIASLAVAFLTLRPRTAVEASPLVRAAVTDHVDCMLGRLPLEVTTSDQHETARWLQRRLARPVALPALAPEGTSKMSARMARLAGVDGSQILFDRRGRTLSVFIMPATEVPSAPGRPVAHGGREFFVSQADGYTVVLWRQRDLVYCLVGEGEGVLSLAREYAGSTSG